MPIRIKTILTIISTNLVIILFSIFIGIIYVSQNIKIAQEAAMSIVADIADHSISNEIEILKLKSSKVAQSLVAAADTQWPEILASQIAMYPEFLGAAVFDAGLGRIVAAGEAPAPLTAMEDAHIRRAFQGKNVLNTTYHYGDGIVFYLAVPLPFSQDRILIVTLPGTFFRDRLADFVVWKTGHILLLDAEGTFVSNPRLPWVMGRYNTYKMSEANERFVTMMVMVNKMVRGESGVEYYYIYDVERVAAFRPVMGSEDGWSLAAVAPLPESPFKNINAVLQMTGVVAFFLSIIVALIASIFIKRPFEKIAALKEESELNSKYKSQFLANMSHEIRTPLTAVLGLTELILKTVELDDKTHSNIVKINRAGETLLFLVNDILDISKIEADKLELYPVEYDIPSLLNDTITQTILYVEEKPVELVLNITEDLPNYLYGDDLRIKQILNNLLSNAFKFTKEGTIELGMRCERDGDDIWMTAWVRDTGIGIKPEDMSRLFTLYGKMEDDNRHRGSDRRTEGTGLGLSISKKVAEMMDGSIDVESEYGKGSTFTVKLRQKFAQDVTIGADVVESLKKFHYSVGKFQSERARRLNMSYARVLIVDDNVTNLDVTKGLLGLYNMKIDCVTGGQLAIDAIRGEEVRYNAIFMDHMMPGMDGVEAARNIREEIGTEYARNVPIIALTANAIAGNEEMFLSKGFQAFISKPIDTSRLDAILHQWVRDKAAESLLPESTLSPQEAHGESERILHSGIPGLDISKGIAHFGKNADIYLEVLQSFARNNRPLLDDIKVVHADNVSEYAVIIHGIKGSIYGIFAEEAGREALALEEAAISRNIDYITANNQKFLDIMHKLIADIESVIGEGLRNMKPVKDKPDGALLAQLLSACDDYDIDEIDAAMTEIEKWEYACDDGLAAWLRTHLDQGKYKSIQDKLAGIIQNYKT